MHAKLASAPHLAPGSSALPRTIVVLHGEWASDQHAPITDQLPPACLDRFTLREREVLHLLVTRHTNREMARLLSISERTVETHVANVLRKLDAENRREAAARVWSCAAAG